MKKRFKNTLFFIIFGLLLEICLFFCLNDSEVRAENAKEVEYIVHAQDYGWMNWVSDGEQAGTTGESKRVEAIKIKLGDDEFFPEDAHIKYQVHVQDYGWMDWVSDGKIAGTTGEAKRIEAIRIVLENMDEYDVKYRTHVENKGWMDWKENGQFSGTTNQAKRIEAIKIQVIKKRFEVTLDDGENTVNGFKKDGKHYLFIPKSVDLTNLTLNYKGDVESVSNGVLDDVNRTIVGDFSKVDTLNVKLTNGTQEKVVLIQSDVPAVFVNLKNSILQDVLDNGSKDTKYKAELNITGAEKEADNISDNNVEIKGRGNSTWLYPKKPYQAKLSEKQNLFEISEGKSKKWVLLANHADPTLLKNKIMYDLAVKVGPYGIPSSTFVDLYINNNYVGNYLLSDKIEVGKSRVNLKKDNGVLAEIDDAWGIYEDYNFLTDYNRRIAVKEFGNDDMSDADKKAAMNSFKNSINKFERTLYSPSSKWSDIEKLIDVDSFVKYYLVNEFSTNGDVFFSSTYLVKDGTSDVIHMGPSWDFDRALEENPEDDFMLSETIRIQNNYFKALFRFPEFARRVDDEYIKVVKQYVNEIDVDNSAIEIANSTKMNNIVWYSQKEYNKCLNELKTWLTKRIDYYNSRYNNENIEYSSHVQNIGWQPCVTTGKTSGTTGSGLRLESIAIKLGTEIDENLSIQYCTHVQNVGWQNWVSDGDISGTVGEGKRIEAIMIRLIDKTTGKVSQKYNVKYRAHVQDYGWMGWKSNGSLAGTTGKSKRMEAIEIKIEKK